MIVTGYKIYDGAIEDISLKLLVACMRMRHGLYINRRSGVKQYNEKVKSVADVVSSALEIKYGIRMDKDEYDHVYIQLISKGLFGENDMQRIPDNLFDLVSDALHAIDTEFGTEFHSDINLSVSLCLHIVPLLFRCKYNSFASNPLIDEIKKKYIYEMEISRRFASIVFEYLADYDIHIEEENFNYDYKKWNSFTMTDDELGFFALNFRLALSDRMNVRKNILLVCSSGRRSIELFKYNIDHLYGKYINELKVCSSLELEQMELDGFDMIFTTVSLDQSLYDKPIFYINSVFNEESRILKELEKKDTSYQFFDERFFVRNMECTEKDEVIQLLVNHMRKYMNLADDFLELVLQREKEAPTSFGNLVSFPHPVLLSSDKSFICIGTLKKKIDWGMHKVQLVMLLSASKEDPQQLQNLYELVVKIANNEDNVQLLLKEPNIETIKRIMETE